MKAKAATEVFRKKFLKPLETVNPTKLAAVLFSKKKYQWWSSEGVS